MSKKIDSVLKSVNEKNPEVLVILGPTAVGKTRISIEISKRLNAEIISADSRMIYKKMDIGTSKPTDAERQGVAHHLIDVVNPDELFNVSDFQRMTLLKIEDIKSRGKFPIIVGGTMLYLDSVVDNYLLGDVPPNLEIRTALEKLTNIELFEKLVKLDPIYANQIDINNRRRLIRPLEVIMQGGKKISEIKKRDERKFQFLKIGLCEDREVLYERINQRVEEQIALGLIEETANLAKEYSYDLSSMSGLGYKQIGYYLRGEMSLIQATDVLKRDTRHFAKRQLTWWRKDLEITWC